MTLLAFDITALLYFAFIGIFLVVISIISLVPFFVLKILAPFLSQKRFLKPNYSGKQIPGLGGLVLMVSIIVCSIAVNVWEFLGGSFSRGDGRIIYQVSTQLLLVALGFGILGLIDDIYGDKENQGFKGHITALFKGKFTTGAIKLFGGPILALIFLQPTTHSSLELILDVAAISLIANFFNLLDLAPGRASKFAILGMIGSLFVHYNFWFNYWIIGIIFGVLILDLREKFMLGDVGANFIGAIVGLSLVVGDTSGGYSSEISGNTATIAILIVALLLNVLSELVSFSKIIDGFIPLRWFDELGQTKERKAWSKAKRIESRKR